MFRFRRSRLWTVFAGVLAMAAGLASPQPAQAFTTSLVEFIAAMTVHGGIGYPVITLGPQVPSLECLPLQTGLDNCHPVYDHPRPITVGTTACFNEVTNVDKLSKPPLHIGACSFFTIDTVKPNPPENTITGHCALHGGQISLLFTDALGQDFLLDIHFTGVSGDIVLDGHWFKLDGSGQHGLVVGVADENPVAGTGGQSCLNKTQEDFFIPGTMRLDTDVTL